MDNWRYLTYTPEVIEDLEVDKERLREAKYFSYADQIDRQAFNELVFVAPLIDYIESNGNVSIIDTALDKELAYLPSLLVGLLNARIENLDILERDKRKLYLLTNKANKAEPENHLKQFLDSVFSNTDELADFAKTLYSEQKEETLNLKSFQEIVSALSEYSVKEGPGSISRKTVYYNDYTRKNLKRLFVKEMAKESLFESNKIFLATADVFINGYSEFIASQSLGFNHFIDINYSTIASFDFDRENELLELTQYPGRNMFAPLAAAAFNLNPKHKFDLLKVYGDCVFKNF